jgi:hypothetical protein
MKKPLILVACLLLALSFNPVRSHAQIGAGEIFYEWLSDSTYRIFFKGYFDCSGVTEPSTMSLCLSNSCSTTPFTVTMNKVSVNTPAPECPSFPTKCGSTTSALAGYKEVFYSYIVTLPLCNSWKFGIIYANRSNSVNLSSSPFYTETTFNNTGSYRTNSSPYFINSAIYSNCNSIPSIYNSNAIDPNGDSLITSLINVKSSSSCTATPASVVFNSASPSYSIPSNPFQCNNTFATNPSTGALSFTTSVNGEHSYAILVKEYRNGILIGTVTRELRSISYTCPTPPAATFSAPYALINCGTGVNGRIEACAGIPFSFSLYIKSSDTSSQFIGSSNSTFSTPGATITYGNQGQDSIHATYLWIPPTTSAGKMHSVIFTIKDSSCKSPGIVTYYRVSIQMYIWADGGFTQDTNICLGQSVSLLGGNSWSILSGTPGSLSCTTCINPIATPTVTSVYKTITTVCPSFDDTVTIGVTNTTAPTISISANPGTSIISGTSVTFTATTTNCSKPDYIWKKNGATIPGAVGNIYTTSSLANNDSIYCVLTCADSCPSPKIQNSNALKMTVTLGVPHTTNSNVISVNPNPSDGKFIIRFNAEVGNGTITISNQLGQVVYTGNTNQTTIDLKDQPNGLYILNLQTKNATVVHKLMINK